ncbi:MAG: class I SAM-dependent methyltransferase [Pirellula sp.]
MHFTVEAQSIAKRYLEAGAIAIDATTGNGFDTLFLAEQVGDSGLVYGVDIQTHAIEAVRQKLQHAGTSHRCRLTACSHAQLNAIVDKSHQGAISVAMFNLGYLPFGDKTIVTQPESTIMALDQVAGLIRPGGLISILAYLGHNGGKTEALQVGQWVETKKDQFDVERHQDAGNENSPILWAFTKRFKT